MGARTVPATRAPQLPVSGALRLPRHGLLGHEETASYEERHAIAELAPVGVGIVDLDGRTILTNERSLAADGSTVRGRLRASLLRDEDDRPALAVG